MKISKLKIQDQRLLFCILHFAFCISAIFAQSTDQNFPTAVTTNEISGTIRARDVGDARLTSYFYVFNGNQGDIFINVVTKNLDGDIDIFTADNLRPLTKIRVYSDNPEGETGRVIYLRQPLRLILRVEGRTPTDDPATFRIKFAGSFQPAAGIAETDESKQPEVKGVEETDVRVNSVGTIIEVKPKPKPTPKTEIARVEKAESKKSAEETEPEKVEPETAQRDEPEERKEENKVEDKEEIKEDKKPEVIVTENIPEKKDEAEIKSEEDAAEKEAPKKEVKPKKPRPAPKTEKRSEVTAVDPAELAGIQLIVEFKDGRKLELPMNRILRFGVDKGILTVITRDGSIGRYSMLDILKMTVE